MPTTATARIHASKKHAGILEKGMRRVVAPTHAGNIDIQYLIRNAVQKDPKLALAYACHFAHESYAEDLIGQAASLHPEAALKYADRYAGQPYAARIILQAASHAPEAALRYAHRYADRLYAADVIRAAAEAFPVAALKYADRYGHESYAENIVRRAAAVKPVETLLHARSLSRLPYAEDILRRASAKDPWMVAQPTRQVAPLPKENLFAVHAKPIRVSDWEHLLFDWSGRVTASVQLLCTLVVHGSFIASALTAPYRTGDAIEIGIAAWLTFMIWLALITTSKRLHDANLSGLYALVILVPCLGPFLLIGAALLPGTDTRNEYGNVRHSLI